MANTTGAAVITATQSPGNGPPRREDISAVAAKVYAALKAGQTAIAETLVKDRREVCTVATGRTELPHGDALLYGGQVVVHVDEHDVVQSHTVLPGCVDYADEQITIFHDSDAVLTEADMATPPPKYYVQGAVEASAILGEPQEIAVEASATWVALVSRSGGYVAWRRGSKQVLRSENVTPPSATDDQRDATATLYNARVVGTYLLTLRKQAITLHRPDSSAVAVRGCTGEFLGASVVPGGIAIHVGSKGVDTSLCLVNDNGRTSNVMALGHGLCGMASGQPCQWTLMLTSKNLLGFSTVSNDWQFVDTKTGRRRPLRGEPCFTITNYHTCGDTLCVVGSPCVTRSDGSDDYGQLQEIAGALQFRALPQPAAETVKPSWCAVGDLLLPC